MLVKVALNPAFTCHGYFQHCNCNERSNLALAAQSWCWGYWGPNVWDIQIICADVML